MPNHVPCDGPALAEAVIAAASDGLVAINREGRILVFNPAAGRIFGRDPAQMLGQSLECLFEPGAFGEHQHYVANFFAGAGRGVVGTTIEATGLHSSGAAVPLEISLSATQISGQPFVLASIHDLTKRYEAERRHHQLLDELLQAQKMEALGTLTAGIAHDFNNMLGAIMGYASAVIDELEPGHPHQEDAHQILTVARRARQLTEKLLGFARRSDFQAEVFALNRVVQDVVGLLSRTIPKNIVLKTKLARDVHSEGDRTQIEQVLFNICLNARDALPSGGELQIQTQRVHLDESQATPLDLSPGAYCQLVVRDNGVGMAPEMLSRVFDPFFSTKPPGRGSGLGLWLVHTTVKRHGGHVQITSKQGYGTEVTVYLPASDARPEPESTALDEARQAQVPGKGEVILVVDDEKHLREMAKRLLQGLGYGVMLAESGEEAEAIYRKHREAIHLVVLDVMLAGISGAETLGRLREINPAVRVLVSSGYGREDGPEHLLQQGVSGFIQKPYGIEEMSKAITRALGEVPLKRG